MAGLSWQRLCVEDIERKRTIKRKDMINNAEIHTMRGIDGMLIQKEMEGK